MYRHQMGRLQLAAVGVFGGATFYHYRVQDLRATRAYAEMVTNIGLPLLRQLDAEEAHGASIRAASFGLTPRDDAVNCIVRHKALGSVVAGLHFRSPVGLAAGFDKQAEAPGSLLSAGFGFVEVGTVTPLPQPGNARPRMFRLIEDRAVINRFGFNSDGGAVIQDRLFNFWMPLLRAGTPPGVAVSGGNGQKYKGSSSLPRGIVGVNIGKNKDGIAEADYKEGTKRLAPFADYLCVNVSSPNTVGLRALQGKAVLLELLKVVKNARDELPWGSDKLTVADQYSPAGLVAHRPHAPPIFVKIAPDLSAMELKDIAAAVQEAGIDGIIVSNTTVARPTSLMSSQDITSQVGGLSGAPLFDTSTVVLRDLYILTKGKVPLIGVGGVSSPEQAYAKIRAGASLVQLYTALAYEGKGGGA